MASSRRSLPPALERARRYALVHYQDYQDVSAGRPEVSAARVAKRARILRGFIGFGAALYLAPQLWEVVTTVTDEDSTLLDLLLKAGTVIAVGIITFFELGAVAAGLDELAAAAPAPESGDTAADRTDPAPTSK